MEQVLRGLETQRQRPPWSLLPKGPSWRGTTPDLISTLDQNLVRGACVYGCQVWSSFCECLTTGHVRSPCLAPSQSSVLF